MKMKPLKIYRMVLTKLSMCQSDVYESQREEVIRILFNCIFFVIIVSYALSSAVFIWKTDDLEEKLYAFFQICGSLVMIYPFIVMILLRRKIASIFDELSELFDECKI